MNHSTIVSISGLVKRFPIGGGWFTALNGIDLTFGKGEFAGLVGPSGSGKTTLLNIIGSLDAPTEGSAVVLGQSIGELSHRQAARLRNEHLGFIFQTYNLLPVYTVFENVEFPLVLQKKSPELRAQRVKKVIEEVELSEFSKHKPDELSGGQRQRVAIARALVSEPEIILADEPTANLDSETGQTIIELMLKINKEDNATFIFSTHDPKVMEHASRKVVLRDGRIDSIV